MNFLNLLMGGTVFLSVSAFIALSAALIEGWIQRNEMAEKAPEYRLVLSILRWLSVAGWFVTVTLMANYIWRFNTGLPGSTQPGPVSNTVVSLSSFVVVYGFVALVGVVYLYLLWRSDEPSEAEREQRRRQASMRARAEQRRRRGRRV